MINKVLIIIIVNDFSFILSLFKSLKKAVPCSIHEKIKASRRFRLTGVALLRETVTLRVSFFCEFIDNIVFYVFHNTGKHEIKL